MIHTTEVTRFKSGKRKGEIKEVKDVSYDLYENDPDFIPIVVTLGKIQRPADFCSCDDGPSEIVLYACPMCGTIKIET